MLRQYTASQYTNTMQLLYMYKISIKHGVYDRSHLSTFIKLSVSVIDGRWYAEIKRTKKFGAKYDWKTILHTYVMNQMSNKNRNTEKIDTLIKMFQSKKVLTLEVLALFEDKNE